MEKVPNSDFILEKNKEVRSNLNTVSIDVKKNTDRRVTEGLASTIGKKETEIKKKYGVPSRVDRSAYGYDWWIYNRDEDHYFQLAIQNGKVVSAYGIGNKVNVKPFQIGEPLDQIYSRFHVKTTVDLTANGSEYRFELSEEDMNMRPIIELGNTYAQLYLDKFTGTVSSVRFLDKMTLLKQRPYALSYRGTLIHQEKLSGDDWAKIEEGTDQQIFDITNIMRKRFRIPELEWDKQTAEVAFQHSLDMSEGHYFSHVSKTKGDLANRLKTGNVSYHMAGENIAFNYVDAIAVMEGWLNSKPHRESLLNQDFTYLGVGVYQKYYTQNFITR